MFRLVTTSHFERAAKRFLRAHPELRSNVERVLNDLKTDPYQAHLRLHPLHGTLAGQHAVRIIHAYRIVVHLLVTEREIVLLDIGSHDDVYR